jgi:hypothetical protein
MRFLTMDEKKRELAHLEEAIERGSPEDAGGRGYIDLPFVPYLRRINAHRGICTLQSCTGHRLKSNIDGQDYYECGELWLRFNAHVFASFNLRVAELAREPFIERIATVYPWKTRDVEPYVSIQFQGVERGCFPESAETITQWLVSL